MTKNPKNAPSVPKNYFMPPQNDSDHAECDGSSMWLRRFQPIINTINST